jgi:hypothetical protein
MLNGQRRRVRCVEESGSQNDEEIQTCDVGTAVAYPNAEDDFARITKVPVFKGNLNVGHGGTYRQQGGGWFGEVAVAWLDYQLKGNADAAKWFEGADCRLCKESVWSIEKKGMR